MSPEERRSAIITAVLPLIQERGRDVSSRELAEAAGVAEGTLFRAFGDKESLIAAAVAAYFDPEPFRERLRGIDPEEPTERKVADLLRLMRERWEGVLGLFHALGIHDHPSHDDIAAEFATWVDALEPVFRPGELRVELETLVASLRLIAFATAIPHFNAPRPFSDDELIDLVLHGTLATDRKN